MESLRHAQVVELANGFDSKEIQNVVNAWSRFTTQEDKVSFEMYSSLVRLGDSPEIAIATVLETKRIYNDVESNYFVTFHKHLLDR